MRSTRCSVAVAGAATVVALLLVGSRISAEALPMRLGDTEFWTLVSDLSEPDGNFRSENLLSNEVRLQGVIPNLLKVAKPGRVYMGVGPEQNFTYIAALKPSMAFIVDIRRGNLDLHLMYKALFDLSADRREFVSRLFSRPISRGLDADASATELFEAAAMVEGDEALYRANLAAIIERLVAGHHFPLSSDDLAGVEYVYRAFFTFGPRLRYSTNGGPGGPSQPTYADLMVSSDYGGQNRAFLATEENFAIVKDLQSRNMIVPVVGNFGGPSAIRQIAAYLHDRSAVVSAFYVSNVEQYLRQDQLWDAFCANVARLPLDDTSTFIRAVLGRGQGSGFLSELGPIAREVGSCRE
jgi:hypothetical protein